ncbi:MAG: hypothetical protein ACREKJ_11780 [Candidatus Rokuibacteriota bacterium]
MGTAPNPTGLVTLLTKLTGQVLRVPRWLRGRPSRRGMTPASQEAGVLHCHTAWVPTCYGRHIKMDYSAYQAPVDVAFDHLANAHSKQGWFRLTAGCASPIRSRCWG